MSKDLSLNALADLQKAVQELTMEVRVVLAALQGITPPQPDEDEDEDDDLPPMSAEEQEEARQRLRQVDTREDEFQPRSGYDPRYLAAREAVARHRTDGVLRRAETRSAILNIIMASPGREAWSSELRSMIPGGYHRIVSEVLDDLVEEGTLERWGVKEKKGPGAPRIRYGVRTS